MEGDSRGSFFEYGRSSISFLTLVKSRLEYADGSADSGHTRERERD